MKKKVFEALLVVVQFSTIGYLVLSSSWLSMPAWIIIITLLSGVLAAWSILIMQLDNLKVLPSPGMHARLITSGPYRIIRHPMYTSLLLLAYPLVISEFTLVRLSIAILLTLDLIIKLNYEEKLLLSKFPEYEAYRKRTSRVIPMIY